MPSFLQDIRYAIRTLSRSGQALAIAADRRLPVHTVAGGGHARTTSASLEQADRLSYPATRGAGGRITAVRTYVPTYHGDGRADWTFAVAITYRDTAAMTGPSNEADIVRKLFPDQMTFRREEQRRFELLDAHWDVPLNEVDMDAPTSTKEPIFAER